jgi:hypothetical protein
LIFFISHSRGYYLKATIKYLDFVIFYDDGDGGDDGAFSYS